jgi:putative ABC transport system substrate-binding protein
MKRREFITLLGGAAAWPLAARAQQALPVVGFISNSNANTSARYVAAFRKGLSETGNVEGQNVTVEYYWLEGQYDRLSALASDLVRRRVAVIVSPSATPATLAVKAATSTIPIVFGAADDPVKLGLVASLARPGGNATGVNSFGQEVTSKRLALLHELVPRAVRIAVLVNPGNVQGSEATLKGVREAAHTLGLEVLVGNASTSGEIDAAFAAFRRERAQALFVANNNLFGTRWVQLATLAARDGLPTSYGARDFVEAGGLMSYGTPLADTYRQLGIYTGTILKGTKPADLPVMQLTKFEFIINLQTAKTLGLEVPPMLLARADEVIE